MPFWTDPVVRYLAFGYCVLLLFVALLMGWRPDE